MQTVKINSLGLIINFGVPSTVEEYDNLAKKQGACLESGIMNVLYRSTLAKFRPLLADRIENQTSIARKTETVLGKDGQPKKDEDGTVVEKYIESEAEYLDRVCAVLVENKTFASTEAALASFGTLAQEVADTLVFDPSEKERQPAGPKKIAKAYLEVAQKAADSGKIEALASKLATKLGNWKVDATVESVARAISEDQRRIREATKLGADYGVE